jgi:signal peptidase
MQNYLRAARQTLSLMILTLLFVISAGLAILYGQGDRLLSVQTASMTPVFRPGDAVYVKPLKSGEVRKGQIVSYRSLIDPKITISHRVVGINDSQLITRGDALNQNDPPFGSDRLIGQGVAVLPKLGYVMEFLRKPIGISLLVFLPAGLILYREGRHLAEIMLLKQYRLYDY